MILAPLALLCMLLANIAGPVQDVVTIHVRFLLDGGGPAHAGAHAAAPVSVVWLSPVDEIHQPHLSVAPRTFTMVQQNKMFSPSLLVVPVGSVVSFPNKDPFFHNVFSLFNGQRFDLGLYQAGESREVTFVRPGASYIFCNIHPEMAATIVALDTPLYAQTDKMGDASISHVPPGRYTLHIWSASASPAELSTLTHEVQVTVKTPMDLGLITVHGSRTPETQHLNKFGQAYDASHPGQPY